MCRLRKGRRASARTRCFQRGSRGSPFRFPAVLCVVPLVMLVSHFCLSRVFLFLISPADRSWPRVARGLQHASFHSAVRITATRVLLCERLKTPVASEHSRRQTKMTPPPGGTGRTLGDLQRFPGASRDWSNDARKKGEREIVVVESLPVRLARTGSNLRGRTTVRTAPDSPFFISTVTTTAHAGIHTVRRRINLRNVDR